MYMKKYILSSIILLLAAANTAWGQNVATVNGTGYTTLADALNAAREAAAGGWNTTSVTVDILTDITFSSNDTWTPIVYNQLNPITINGNNKTITNLPGMLYKKQGSGVSTLTINDLTFESPTVTEAGFAAVIMGYGDCVQGLYFNNVTINEASVTATPDNDAYNYAAAFVAYAAGYSNTNDGPLFQNVVFNNCKVTSSTINATSGGSVGALMGHASASTDSRIEVEATTVSGNTISTAGSKKAGALFGTVGAACATTNHPEAGLYVSANVSNNTVTANNTAITTIYGRQGSSTGELTLTEGGSYDSAPIAAADMTAGWAGLEEGTQLTQNSNGTYSVELPDVAKIGTTGYKTLAAAIAAVSSGQTIQLLANIDLGTTGIVIDSGKNFTLDLNSYDITGTVNGKLITNNGTLTISGNGHVYNQDISAQGHDAVYNTGTLVINAGTFGDADDDMTNANALNRGAAVRNYGGTATINGGKFTACDNYTNGGFAYALINDNNGTMTINNAVVYGKNNGNIANNYGQVTVKDGTFTLNNASSYYSLYVDGEDGPAKTIVEGGTFNNTTSNGLLHTDDANNASLEISGGEFTYTNLTNKNSSVVSVSGGTFTSEVPQEFCATGYVPTTADGGMFTVQLGNYVAKIETTPYATLVEAITAAQAGQTIELLTNIDLDSSSPYVIVNKAVTINGGTNQYEIKGTGSAHGTDTEATIVLQGSGAVTLKNLKITNSSSNNNGVGIRGTAYSGKLTIDNCVIKVPMRGVNVMTIDGGFSMVITGSTIQSNVAYPTTAYVNDVDSRGISFSDEDELATIVTITNTKIQGFYYDIFVNEDKQNLTLTMDGVEAYGLYMLNLNGDNSTVNLNGGTTFSACTNGKLVTDEAAYAASTNIIYLDEATKTATTNNVLNAVTALTTVSAGTGKYKLVSASAAVAQIGTTKYETLAEAITAATAGQTITLLTDITLTSTQTISKAITIDGGDYTVTKSGGVAFELTGSNDVTFQNLNVNVTGNNGRAIKAGNDNTAYSGKLTVDNCTLTAFERGIDIYEPGNGVSVTAIGTTIKSTVADPTTEYTTNSAGTRGVALWTFGTSYDVTLTNCIIEGFSYDINVAGDGPINVTMTGGKTYGRAAVNNWTSNSIFTLDEVEVHGLNNQTGSTEGFACIVDNEETNNNTYNINNCSITAAMNEAASSTPGSSATEYLIDLRGTGSTANFTGGTTYAVNDPARGGLIPSESLYAESTNSIILDEATVTSLAGTLDDLETLVAVSDGQGNYTLAPAVAKIGDTKYATLAAAIAAVPTDGTATTITMIADETIDGNTGLTIASAKNIVLDLNGKTVKQNVTSAAASTFITNNGTLTIQDNSTNHDGVLIAEGTNVGSSSYSYGNYTINNSGTLNVVSGTVESKMGSGACYAINNTGIATISGGKVKGDDTAIRLLCNSTSNTATLSMSDGEIEGKWGVYVQNANNNANKGSMTVTGGKITATEKDCIYVDSNADWTSGLDVKLQGGTFEAGRNALRVMDYGNVQVKISGFTVSGGDYTTTEEALFGDRLTDKILNVISGGTFNKVVPAANCAENYIPVTTPDANGMYTVQVSAACAVASITNTNNETTYYLTLEAAFAAATTDQTINMLTDVTLSEPMNVDLGVKRVTLDLGGNTLAGRTNLKSGDLTIKNGTVAGGSEQALNVYGSADSSAENYSVLNINSDVNVTADVYGVCLFGPTFNSKPGYGAVINIYGTVTTTGDEKNGAVFVSGNLGQNIDGDMKNVINVYGTITSATDAAIALNGNATVNVKDGATITGNTAIAIKRGTLNVVDGATVHATGLGNIPTAGNNNGTEMTGAAVSMTNTYNQYGPMQVNISGGSFTSDHAMALYKQEGTYQNDATYAVSGGIFNTAVPEEFCADGYVPTSITTQGFTQYTVEPGDFVAQIGDTKYTTLAAAVAAVPTNGLETTITLLKNITLVNNVVVGGTFDGTNNSNAKKVTSVTNQNVILNLDGHTITGTKTLYLAGGSLNITGTGTIESTSQDVAPVGVRYVKTDNYPDLDYTSKRTLTIGKNVTLTGAQYGLNIFGTNEKTTANSIEVTVDGTVNGMLFVLGNISNADNNIVINVNGKVDATNATGSEMVKTGIALCGNATVNVNDGATVSGESGIEVRAGSLTVNGGTITATSADYSYTANGSGTTTKGAAIAVAQHGTLVATSATILGGTLGGKKKIAVIAAQNNSLAGVTVIAADGYLTNSDTQTVLPDGYYWLSNGDGTSSPVSNSAVAQIGNTLYSTLAAAVAAVPADGTPTTITLLQNINLTERLFVNAGATPAYAGTNNRYATTTENKNITLELDGHNIVSSSNIALAGGSLNITNNGTADATHGVISTTAGGLAPIEVRGTGDLTKKRTLTIGTGVTLSGAEYGLNIFGSNDQQKNIIDVNVNGTVKGMLFVLGNLKNADNEININVNGTVDASNATGSEAVHTGIALSGNANVTVANGATVKGESGIEVRAGSLTVNGGTITATSADYGFAGNGNGMTTKGTAIAVAQHNTNLPIDVTLSGGTLTGTKKIAVNDVNGNDLTDVSVVASNSFLTNAGTDTEIPAGFLWVDNGNNTKKLVLAPVRRNDVGYATLAEAIAAVENNDIIKLFADITLTDDITCTLASGSTFTIDFNNHNVIRNDNHVVLPTGVSVLTNEQTQLFTAADEGYVVVESNSGNTDYPYEYSIVTAYFTENGITYHHANEGNEVSVGNTGKTLAVDPTVTGSTVTVPTTITHDNKTFTVTGVEQNAFGSDAITGIVLPATIAEVENGAFNGADNLRYIDLSTAEGFTPSSLQRNITASPFNGVPKQALVFLNGTTFTGENYVYNPGSGNQYYCEVFKIYDDLSGAQTGFGGDDYKWAFENPHQFTAYSVENTRQLTAERHYTICLPYALEIPNNVKAYTLEATSNQLFGFTEVTGTLAAYTPYVLIPTKSGQLLGTNNNTVIPAFPATADTDATKLNGVNPANSNFTFYGTMRYMEGADAAGKYIMQYKDNKSTWLSIDEGTAGFNESNRACILPMRAYIASTTGGARSFTATFTDIDGIIRTETFTLDDEDTVIYDLSGRRVKNVEHGHPYIINGKKVIVK